MRRVSAELTRRELLRRAGIAFVAFQAAPALNLARAVALAPRAPDPLSDATGAVPTMEAFADTLIPGKKRFPGDAAIAGVVSDDGAVQAGAVDLLYFSGTQISEIIAPCAATMNARAAVFDPAAVAASPSVPPFVALSFEKRTALVLQLFDEQDGQLWEALGAVVFLAFHTAGHLHTADAALGGHPGLEWIGFPKPSRWGIWGWSPSSYGPSPLADLHPQTVGKGSPS